MANDPFGSSQSQLFPNNPSMETLIAVVGERMSGITALINQRLDGVQQQIGVVSSRMGDLEERERERNGSIAGLLHYKGENEQHWAEHMTWAQDRAAKQDEAFSDIKALKQDKFEGQVKHKVWKELAASFVGGGTLTIGVIKLAWELGFIQGG